MKISDFIFKFPSNTVSNCDGLCRVRIFAEINNVVTLITDISDLYPCASVTNSIENIRLALIQKGLVNEQSIFIEHYEKNEFSDASFDIVDFDNKGIPKWSGVTKEKLEELLGCDDNELFDLTKKNKRILSEIDKIKYRINPNNDFYFQESPDIIKRKIEIEENKISKNQLIKIVENGAKEQDISQMLKSDLSILAEIYAYPKDEYICFSEFPIGDGYADYMILTGRSRMDAYIIEIKGADFDLVNKSGDKFNEKISEADMQIKTRLGFIYRNYEFFRKSIHDTRRKVENGEIVYNSFKGAISKLCVDSQKDINIHSVIVGGRTGDDYQESLLRHNYEMDSRFKTKLETWDTFIRKLVRK